MLTLFFPFFVAGTPIPRPLSFLISAARSPRYWCILELAKVPFVPAAPSLSVLLSAVAGPLHIPPLLVAVLEGGPGRKIVLHLVFVGVGLLLPGTSFGSSRGNWEGDDCAPGRRRGLLRSLWEKQEE